MTNRTIPQIYYVTENEDGTLTFISSSRGSENVVTEQSKVIKKNVVANNICNYVKISPNAEGCDWVSV